MNISKMSNLPIKEIVFGSDTAHRKQWFKGLSFAHPAKMHLSLQIYLIEHYTKPGDIVLDPMLGSGTLLVACALGRNVIGVELEQKFVDMAKANWERIKSLGPILGYTMGTATILQGDSRQLPELLADVICTSPPYAETTRDAKSGYLDERLSGEYDKKRGYKNSHQIYSISAGYGKNPSNIGNLKYGEIDKVIMSPPYEGANIGDNRKTHNLAIQGLTKDGKPRGGSLKTKYQADVICTSPPYEGVTQKLPDNIHIPITGSLQSKGTAGVKLAKFSDNQDNIGNLKGESYLSAMALVYAGCYRILKDKGLMILVVKPFIRDKKVVHLEEDTRKLCENAGFKFVEMFYRKLTNVSFWRRIYEQKFPEVEKIDKEYILVFKKKG